MADNPDKKKKCRPAGSGQVIERTEGKKYLIRVFRGYKPNGQNDYFNKTFHGAKTEAEKWLRGALARRDRGEPLEDPDISFEALFNEWMEQQEAQAADQEIYQDNFKYYIKKIWLGEDLFDSFPRRSEVGKRDG